MILLLLAVPILLPIALAAFGIGQRSYYVGLSVGFFMLALLMGLIGREVKSEVLFGIWILIVVALGSAKPVCQSGGTESFSESLPILAISSGFLHLQSLPFRRRLV